MTIKLATMTYPQLPENKENTEEGENLMTIE
jgi:hypothetical protein